MKRSKTHPPLPRALALALRPFQKFFRTESAGGLLLLAATAAAFVWANSSAAEAYHRLLGQKIGIQAFGHGLSWPLHHWINDGLMAVFFLVVGMEIKRELVEGELSEFRRALLPAIAAAGGMLVPALIFLVFNGDGPETRGWGVPVATDIAFALGCLALLKGRVPSSLAVFLTALAIFDDLGAVLVIALFYGHGVELLPLAGAAGTTLLLLGANRLGIKRFWPYIGLGILLWLAFLASGIHATMAGVVLGLCLPVWRAEGNGESSPPEPSVLDRLLEVLHPWVAFFVVPLFALANAGVDLRGSSVDILFAPVALGIALGLFFGKQIGIFCALWLAVRLRLCPMPSGASWRQAYGVAVLGGIGFTMSLFIGALAFAGHPLLGMEAKLGILVGSLASAVVGLAFLRFTLRSTTRP